MSDWAPPGRFDGLRIGRPLGQGGMGASYLAQDEALDRPTALKWISAESPSQALRARFLVEARALARLQHPNVVGVYRFGEVDGRPYLAYEFVEGGTLAALGALPLPRVLRLGLQIARGLAAAHERCVVHRDAKPANIMVGVDGSVELVDFDLAVLGASGDQPAQALTLDGRVVGAPATMAPERWLREAPSPAAEVWAWAMVCRQLLTGVHPLDGVAPGQLPRRLTLDELPTCGREAPQAPPVLCSDFDRCPGGLPVIWVSLAEARDPGSALSLVLRALGRRDAQGEPLSALRETLDDQPALLFLDDLGDALADSLGALPEQCPEATCVLTGDLIELDSAIAQLRAQRQAAGRPAWDASLRWAAAMQADRSGEGDRAWALCLEATESDGGNRRRRAANHSNLALFADRRGDGSRALTESERCVALLRALGRPADLPRPLWTRVDCLVRLGQAGAADALREAARGTLAVEGHLALRVRAPVLHRLGWRSHPDPSAAAWRAALQAGLDGGG